MLKPALRASPSKARRSASDLWNWESWLLVWDTFVSGSLVAYLLVHCQMLLTCQRFRQLDQAWTPKGLLFVETCMLAEMRRKGAVTTRTVVEYMVMMAPTSVAGRKTTPQQDFGFCR
jgi:hypothetical protein